MFLLSSVQNLNTGHPISATQLPCVTHLDTPNVTECQYSGVSEETRLAVRQWPTGTAAAETDA